MAKRFSFAVVVLLLLCSSAMAQLITVSGTVQDSIGLPYANGTVVASLNSSASPTLNGQPYTPPTQPFGLDTGGKFSFNVAANNQLQPAGSTWSFTVCSGAGTVPISWGRQSVCFQANNLTLNSSADISAELISSAEPLTYSASFLATPSSTCPVLHGLVDFDLTHLDASGRATVAPAALGSQNAVGFAVFVPGAQCQGTVQVATALVVPCVTDDQTTVGNWVTASSSVRSECHDYGSAFSSALTTYGQVMRANSGAGTISMIYISPFLSRGAGGGAGGSGTLTNFTATNNVTSLFTTAVTNSTTAPILTFSNASAPPNTMWGNSGTSAGPPSWITIPTGGGGGNGSLNGCQTATAGNLTCDSSMAVTASGVGSLQLAGGALPTPPAGVTGQLVADPTGAAYWSTGTGAAFTKLATTTDVSNSLAGALTPSNFSTCNTMGWSTANGAQTCADLQSNIQNNSSYTITASDANRVIQHRFSGVVTDTLAAPANTLARPFTFWIDTGCVSTVNVTTAGLINGQSSITIGTCGWALVWADTDGVNWHAQIYEPPGGVTVVQ